MITIKNNALIVFAVYCLSYTGIYAQVTKKVVVEHFTNSLCSVCASRNPGFYTNLAAQSNVIHLAIHPSSPYSNCLLNKHNVSENDARTNYYGVYGSTPRLVIQGSVISAGANYAAAGMFSPFLGQTSPVSIKITQFKYAADSIRTRVVIKTESTHNLSNMHLFVALAEDTLFYNSPNGETKHFDVFRKSLTGANGTPIQIAANVGDSVVYSNVSTVSPSWNFARIYSMAVLQNNSTKEVIQAQSVSAKSNGVKAGINQLNAPRDYFMIAVNENKSITVYQSGNQANLFSLYDLSGRLLFQKWMEFSKETIDVSFAPGIYIYTAKSGYYNIKTAKLLIR